MDSTTGNRYLLSQNHTRYVRSFDIHHYHLPYSLEYVIDLQYINMQQDWWELSMGKSCNFANLIRSRPCRNVTLNFLYILFQPLDRKIVRSCIVFRLTFSNVNFIQGKWGLKTAKAFLSTVGKTISAPCHSILQYFLHRHGICCFEICFLNRTICIMLTKSISALILS